MALYVAICLLGALTVAADRHLADAGVFAIIWGTTIGLAIAHWFAFRLSARLVGDGSIGRHEVEVSVAQLAGAASVGALASVPVVLFGDSAELNAVRLTVACFIAVVGLLVARTSGASPLRATIYGIGTLVAALTIALVKNALAGH